MPHKPDFELASRQMTSRFTITIPSGIAKALLPVLEEVFVEKMANGVEGIYSTLAYFRYWLRDGRRCSFSFVNWAGGARLSFKHAAQLREMLLIVRTRTNGQTRAAVCRRIAKIESVLDIDPITRLGAIVEAPGRTVPTVDCGGQS